MEMARFKLAVVASIGLFVLAGCTAPEPAPAPTPQSEEPAVEDAPSGSAMEITLAYIEQGLPDLSGSSIAYLTECGPENAYCQVRLQAAEEAAAELGATLTVFNAAFNPQTQVQQVQDAILRDFDGYVLSPVADSVGCASFELIQATGKPVVNINSPMCGNADYTEGTVGFVASQTETFYLEHVRNAFSSCEGDCKAVMVGGFVGSDLYGRWSRAISRASVEFPNVEIVANQPGDYDAATALTVVQDALTSHPDLGVVVTAWDEMTSGVEQAVETADLKPGSDVRIYSIGGTKDGVERVAAGKWTSTTILLPFEESFYGFVQLARAMATGESTPGFTFLGEAPAVVDGPGTIFVSTENASSYSARF